MALFDDSGVDLGRWWEAEQEHESFVPEAARCRFCGQEQAKMIRRPRRLPPGDGCEKPFVYFVLCLACLAHGPVSCWGADEALTLWNGNGLHPQPEQ